MKNHHPMSHTPKLSTICSATLGFALLCQASLAIGAPDATYTLDMDFDQGSLLNVNHNAPDNNQLQLNTVTAPFPFVNIAASQRGTAVRIDVNTGAILGEYLTAPDGMGRNPSRTTVDQQGNVWVANRDESGLSGGEAKGSVARVGVIIGGTRSDADGAANPAGQYLAPPFQYNTCVDRDNDGLIMTSAGLGNILPWTNTGGADTDGGVSTADDECVINYTRVSGTGTRTLAVDANNDLWVGGLGDRDHEKLSGVTGLPVPGTQINYGCGGYGGLIDGYGFLWSSSSSDTLLRFDTSSVPPPPGIGACLNTGGFVYGLGIDPNTGHIWATEFSPQVIVRELDSLGNSLNTYPLGGFAFAQGIAVDSNSHVWAAEVFGTRVAHFAPDLANPGSHIFVGTVAGFNGTTGVAVDANGKIWAPEMMGNSASRIDPTSGPIGGGGYPVGAIDMTVPLGDGAGPYNYSDMTGFVAIGATSPQGNWTVVHDSGISGNTWGTIIWNTEPEGSVPAGSSITVEARAAETQIGLASETFITVANNIPFSLSGQFIEVRATLKQPDSQGDSPVLSDLSIKSANLPPDCSTAAPSVDTVWPPNHKLVGASIVGVIDPDGDPITITPTGVSQDEPTQGASSGNTSPDATLTPLAVRAERNGNPKTPGNGRVYHIGFTASDGQGGSCTGMVMVCVPHDQGQGKACIDEGALFNSLAP